MTKDKDAITVHTLKEIDAAIRRVGKPEAARPQPLYETTFPKPILKLLGKVRDLRLQERALYRQRAKLLLLVNRRLLDMGVHFDAFDDNNFTYRETVARAEARIAEKRQKRQQLLKTLRELKSSALEALGNGQPLNAHLKTLIELLDQEGL